MSEQTTTPNSEYVKPCRKCGAQERYADTKCKPCVRARVNKYKMAHSDKVRQSKERYRRENSEKIRSEQRKWYLQNREKVCESVRKYGKANPEKVRENSRRWVAANPKKAKDVAARRRHNRRARESGNGGTLSKGIVQSLLCIQKGKCACGCGASLKETGHHLDHIMPISLGGQNSDNNVQLLTPTCNLRKGAKHPDDWARELGRVA